MPQSEGGYFSLDQNGTDSVYNTTTEPTSPNTVLETVKRVIGQVMTGSQAEPTLLGGQNRSTNVTIVSMR